MRMLIKPWSLLALCCALAAISAPAADDKAEPAKSGPLLIVDGAGKEQKLKAWKFAQGTRHLTWLAPEEKPPAEPKDKPPPAKGAPKARPAIGPEALEFRDEQSTNFVDGILTLVPLDRIRSLEYDHDKQAVTLKVAVAGGSDESLTGTTKFKGINKITIEAEVDKGDMGIAEIKFLGGVPKGIRSLTFPNPKAAAEVKGNRPASVTIADKQKVVRKVHNLKPLYRLPDGTERLLGTVMFKKTLKVDLDTVQKLHLVEGSKGEEVEWVVTFKDGEEQTLTLLKTMPINEQTATLEGFLGKVPAGYKLYPPHTIAEIVYDEAKSE